eukprot:1287220-Pleurochrysis_carterae.AAC.1
MRIRQQERKREQSRPTARESPARQVGVRTAPVSVDGDSAKREAESMSSTHEAETRGSTARVHTSRTHVRACKGERARRARKCVAHTRVPRERTEYSHAVHPAWQARDVSVRSPAHSRPSPMMPIADRCSRAGRERPPHETRRREAELSRTQGLHR